MATIGTEALANEAQLERDLRRMLTAAPSMMRTGLRRVGQVVEKRAVAYCNISPKKSQIEANLTRGAAKRGASTKITINPNTGQVSVGRSTLRSRRQANPGGLQRSIDVLGVKVTASEASVEVGVPLNSEAGKYAHYIHDQGPRGTRKWTERGIGTKAKGAQAGDKFIERAVDDTGAEQVKILTTTVDRWFKSGGF